jgi:hypothetical protein
VGIRKAVNERGLDSSPVGLADTTAEDEAAMGTAFAFIAFMENESIGKGRVLGGVPGDREAGLLKMRPARSPLRPVDPAMPLLS